MNKASRAIRSAILALQIATLFAGCDTGEVDTGHPLSGRDLNQVLRSALSIIRQDARECDLELLGLHSLAELNDLRLAHVIPVLHASDTSSAAMALLMAGHPEKIGNPTEFLCTVNVNDTTPAFSILIERDSIYHFSGYGYGRSTRAYSDHYASMAAQDIGKSQGFLYMIFLTNLQFSIMYDTHGSTRVSFPFAFPGAAPDSSGTYTVGQAFAKLGI